MEKEKEIKFSIEFKIIKKSLPDSSILCEIWQEEFKEKNDDKTPSTITANQWKCIKSWIENKKDWKDSPSDHRVSGFDF